MLTELVEYSIKNRNKIVEFQDVVNHPSNFERYSSVFPYQAGIRDYVKSTGSVADYTGKRFVPFIIFDVDGEDLFEAQKDTIFLINSLIRTYEISGDDVDVFFSGSKGFHVFLSEKLFGGIEPSEQNISRVKSFVHNIKTKFNIQSIDESIYTTTSLIRVENSLNTKGKMYKIPLTFKELHSHVFEIQKTATSPRLDFKRVKMHSSIPFCQKLKDDFYTRSAEILVSATDFSSAFSPAEQGKRNDTLFKQACLMLNKSEFSTDVIVRLIKLLNSEYTPPLSDDEVDSIIKSAVKTTKKTIGIKKKFTVKPVGEWENEWYDNILPENNKISLLFPRLDNEFKGKLRGKVGVMIGYAGSKKSMYGQNLAYHNSVNHGLRVVYSSMESSAADCNGRFVNMAMGNSYDKNPEQVLMDIEATDPGYAKKIYNEKVSKLYGDRLLVTEDPAMECSTFSEMIDFINESVGVVDMLVIDGLSMMGGLEDATKRAERHSKEAKELAKKHNIFVLIIVHAKRQDDETTRDLSGVARDSEKIRDNCDFYASFSKIQTKSAFGDDVYEQNRGVIRTVNKRGSGNVIDVVFKLDPISLIMSDSGDKINNLSKDF